MSTTTAPEVERRNIGVRIGPPIPTQILRRLASFLPQPPPYPVVQVHPHLPHRVHIGTIVLIARNFQSMYEASGKNYANFALNALNIYGGASRRSKLLSGFIKIYGSESEAKKNLEEMGKYYYETADALIKTLGYGLMLKGQLTGADVRKVIEDVNSALADFANTISLQCYTASQVMQLADQLASKYPNWERIVIKKALEGFANMVVQLMQMKGVDKTCKIAGAIADLYNYYMSGLLNTLSTMVNVPQT